jgi:hypothetical protein
MLDQPQRQKDFPGCLEEARTNTWILKSDRLDDGDSVFHIASQVSVAVSFWMGPCPVTGLQYSRQISIGTDFTWGPFHATVKTWESNQMRSECSSQSRLESETEQDQLTRFLIESLC